jgi:hypothetical protein
VGWSGEEGIWLPEEALPFPGEGGGAAAPTVDPGLGFPTAGRERREPVSAEGTWRGLLEIEDATLFPQGLRRRQWRNSRGCALHAPIPILLSNPSITFEINNISKSYCCLWRGRRRGEAREGLEECCTSRELLCLKVRCVFEDKGRDEQKS